MSFQQTDYIFNIGRQETVHCVVANNSVWQLIAFYQILDDGSPAGIATVDNSTGTPEAQTMPGFDIQLTSDEYGAIVQLVFNNVSCNSSGLYACGVIVGSTDNPLAVKDATANVTVRGKR